MTIGELADAAGCSRRAVRFYVARKLLAPPKGRGRGSYYTARQLDQLRRIQELQRAGHSLEAVAQILRGQKVPAPRPTTSSKAAAHSLLSAKLWTRLRIAEGIELSFDATRHRLTAEQLLQLRETVLGMLREHDECGN